MSERIRQRYSHWKYLGFSKEQLAQYEERIAEENLKLLRIMLSTTIVIIAVAWLLLLCAMSLSPKTDTAIKQSLGILSVTMIVIIVQIIQNHRLEKNGQSMKRKSISRLTTSIFLITIDLTSIIVEVVFYPDAYSTIVCGLLMISQIMFIAYPIDNLIYIICFTFTFVCMDLVFKAPDIYIYDFIDSIPFLLFGLVFSWKNSQIRWRITINAEREKELEKENMENRLKESKMDMMLTQIQPHFIYNTLEGIGELCHSNPAYAEEAVIEFSCFLRGNLSVMNEQKMVPFEQELAHIKHYLYCEKMRFGERLNIEYRINGTDFSVPTLSIQPIVENAVRYGVSKKEEGGTIIIESTEQETEWQVRIIDDGVGFSDQYQYDGKRKHIGIANVRSRLEQLCGGRLEIIDNPQGGTIVLISFPKEYRIRQDIQWD